MEFPDTDRHSSFFFPGNREFWILCLAGVVFLSSGCSSPPKPGVTFNLTILEKAEDGNLMVKGPVEKIVSAPVRTEKTIVLPETTVSLLVRKTEYGKATFEVTYPGQEAKRVRIESGQTQEIFPEEVRFGLRIEVIDCH